MRSFLLHINWSHNGVRECSLVHLLRQSFHIRCEQVMHAKCMQEENEIQLLNFEVVPAHLLAFLLQVTGDKFPGRQSGKIHRFWENKNLKVLLPTQRSIEQLFASPLMFFVLNGNYIIILTLNCIRIYFVQRNVLELKDTQNCCYEYCLYSNSDNSTTDAFWYLL